MRAFLIDFENVKSAGLVGIDTLGIDDQVVILYSANSNTISFEMHQKIITCAANVEYYQIRRGGKNSLDFQLSTLLGYLLASGLYTHLYIVSNDSGFDALYDFWTSQYIPNNCIVYRRPNIAMSVAHSVFTEKKLAVEEAGATPAKPEEELSGDVHEVGDVDVTVTDSGAYEQFEIRQELDSSAKESPLLFGYDESMLDELDDEEIDRIVAEIVKQEGFDKVIQIERDSIAMMDNVLTVVGEFIEKRKNERAEAARKRREEAVPALPEAAESAPEETVAAPEEAAASPEETAAAPEEPAAIPEESEAPAPVYERRRRRRTFAANKPADSTAPAVSDEQPEETELSAAARMRQAELEAEEEEIYVPLSLAAPVVSAGSEAAEQPAAEPLKEASEPAAEETAVNERSRRRRGRPRRGSGKDASSQTNVVNAPKEPAEDTPAKDDAKETAQDAELSDDKPIRQPRRKADPAEAAALSAQLEEMGTLADICSHEQLGSVAEAILISGGKQQFYRSIVRRFGRKKGLQVYEAIKSEYSSLKKK